MSNTSLSGRGLAIALGGPVVQGAALGLREGPLAMLAFALGLPVIVAAVTLLTTPTLYVGGAILGGRLSAGEVAAATGRGLHALGLAMLGLAPLSLLLATTSALFHLPVLLVLLVVALMIALHRLATELEAADGNRHGLGWYLLFAGHTAIAFVIGVRLFSDLVRFGERISS